MKKSIFELCLHESTEVTILNSNGVGCEYIVSKVPGGFIYEDPKGVKLYIPCVEKLNEFQKYAEIPNRRC